MPEWARAILGDRLDWSSVSRGAELRDLGFDSLEVVELIAAAEDSVNLPSEALDEFYDQRPAAPGRGTIGDLLSLAESLSQWAGQRDRSE